jgi:hypothetical protein
MLHLRIHHGAQWAVERRIAIGRRIRLELLILLLIIAAIVLELMIHLVWMSSAQPDRSVRHQSKKAGRVG